MSRDLIGNQSRRARDEVGISRRPCWLVLAHLWARRTSSTQPLGVNDRTPGHATHLPKEVGHHHVWKGLGPPGDLGRAKPDVIRTGARGAGSAKPPCLEGQTGMLGSQYLGVKTAPSWELGYLLPKGPGPSPEGRA